MQEMQVRSLGQEDPLEKGMTTHSSILACETPWTEEPGGLQSMGPQTRTWVSNLFIVQSLSCNPMSCSMPGSLVLHPLSEFAQTHVHWVSDAIQPPHPLLPPSPLALNLFQHQAPLQWYSVHIRWPEYRSFSFSISPSNEYSGLISFRIDWFDPLAVQETLKSLLQHHSSKASILQHN